MIWLFVLMFAVQALATGIPDSDTSRSASKKAKPSDSFAANAISGIGAEVNRQTGQLDINIKCFELPGVTDEMDASLSLARHDVLPGDDSTVYKLPSGWKWDIDYVDVKNKILNISGNANLTIDPRWTPSGLRFIKNRMFKIEELSAEAPLPYDKRKYSYRFSMIDGSGRYFDRFGRLICSDDRFGNHILYYYDADDYIEKCGLLKIVDSYGQSIDFSYSGGLPAKEVVITMPDKRTAVCSFNITPTYDSNVALVSPDGRKAVLKLLPDGRVREIVYPSGGSVFYEYKDNAISYMLVKGEQPKYFPAVCTVTEDPKSEGSAKMITDYDYRSSGKFYTGYPTYPFGENALIQSNDNSFKFVTKATMRRSTENGGDVQEITTFNHLNLILQTETYQNGKLKRAQTPKYAGQDAAGLFPSLSQLDGNYGRTLETLDKIEGRVINNETFAYNADGLVSSKTDRIGDATAKTQTDYFEKYGLVKKSVLEDSADKAGEIITKNKLDTSGKYIEESVIKRGEETIKTVVSMDGHGRETLRKTEKNSGGKPYIASEKYSYKKSGEPGKEHELTTITTDGLGNETSVTIDIRNGFIIRKTDAMGRSIVYDYDKERKGLLVTKRYPDESRESIDGSDPLKIVKKSSSGITETEYLDGFGRVVKRTDNKGLNGAERTVYVCTYNELGEISTETDMFSRTTKRFYNDWSGRETKTVDSLGNTTTNEYDYGKMIETVSFNGIILAKKEYNDNGDVIKAVDFLKGAPGSALHPVIEYSYNGKDQVISTNMLMASGMGVNGKDIVSTITSYDLEGNAGSSIVKTSDGAASAAVASFNAFGYVDGSKIKYSGVSPGVDKKLTGFDSEAKEYDAAGNIIKVTNLLKQSMSFEYDKNGNRILMKDFDDKKTVYEYDVMDRLISTKSGKMTATVKYYPAGTPGGEGLVSSRELFADGKLIDRIEYGYDARGLLVKIAHMNGKTIQYEYDSYERLTGLTDINGVKTATAYDPKIPENVISEENASGRIEYSYYPPETGGLFGRGDVLKQVSCSNGVKIAYDYYNPESNSASSGALKIKSITTTGSAGAILNSSAYFYDERGRIAKIIRKSDNGGDANNIRQFSYNDNNQLIGDETLTIEGSPISKTSYVYDIRGNIVSKTITGAQSETAGQTMFKYDADNKLESSTGPDGTVSKFSYSTDGSVKSISVNGKIVKSLKYDDFGELTGYLESGGVNISYSYGADGLRRMKKDEKTGYSISYYYNADKQVINEEDSKGHRASMLSDMMRIVDGKRQWLISDVKDVLGYTDEKAQKAIEEYCFTAYGKETGKAPAASGKTDAFSILDNPYRYSGYLFDEDSGMYYLNARFYSPELMRFISRDAIDLTNKYAYADGNPVELVDPDGESALVILAVVSVATGVAGTMSHIAADKWVRDKNWKIALHSIGVAFDITSIVTGKKAYNAYNIYKLEKSRRLAMQATAYRSAANQMSNIQQARRIQRAGVRVAALDNIEVHLQQMRNRNLQKSMRLHKRRYVQQIESHNSRNTNFNIFQPQRKNAYKKTKLPEIRETGEMQQAQIVQQNQQQLNNMQAVNNNARQSQDAVENALKEWEDWANKTGYIERQ